MTLAARGPVKVIDTGYKPRALQAYMHARLKRFNVLVCHRRFGKTVFCVNEQIDRALRNDLHNPQYAYIAPTYKQAKMIAWEYFKDYCRNIPGYDYSEKDLTITIHRQGKKDASGNWTKQPDKIRFMLLGSENPDSIRGIYLDGAIVDEYAQCDPIIWGEVLRPALSDRKGWVIFIGTPKGRNHFYNRYEMALGNESWFTQIFKASETGIISAGELEEMRKDMSDEEYQQEMECDFAAANAGSYFGSILAKIEAEGHFRDLPYNPGLPVDTFWDLGLADSTAIWFRQKTKFGYNYIDYAEFSASTPKDSALAKTILPMKEGVKDIAKFLREKPYLYGRHVWPWDGKTREFTSGQTRQEFMRKLGFTVEIQERQSLDDGIQASRNMLQLSYFDAVKCARGIDCLRNYQKDYDSKAMLFKNKPRHDWTSHGADSFRYSALDMRESTFGGSLQRELPRQAEMDYDELGR